MDFENNKPIYQQIIDYAFERILSGAWPPDQRIPSVREMSVFLKVNTHTVLKAYDEMQSMDIIVPRRGMGYYLAPDASDKVTRVRRQLFFDETLPRFIAEMKMLGIDPSELHF